MAFGIGDELSVAVTADTQDFERGINQSQDDLDGFRNASLLAAAGLGALQAAADEAEDEVDSVGRSAATSSGSVAALGGAANLSAIGVNQLSGSVVASLVPALGILTAALVPVISALGGFVAAAGAIGAVGILPTMGAIATRGEELKVVFGVLTDTIRTEFAPVFDTAAEVLFSLMGALTDVIPELVPAQDVVSELAGNFAQLGNDVIDLLPAMVDLAVTLTEEFLPPFVTFARRILPEIPGFIRMLASDFRRLLPLLMGAGTTTADLLGTLREVGFTVLPVVASALGTLANVTIQAFGAFGQLNPEVQQLIASASLVAPVLAGLVSILGGIPGIIAAIGIGAFALSWRSNFADIRNITRNFVAELQTILGNRLPALLDAARNAFEVWQPVIEPIINLISRLFSTVLLQAVDTVLVTLTVLSQLLAGDFSGAWDTYSRSIVRAANRIEEVLPTFDDLSQAVTTLPGGEAFLRGLTGGIGAFEEGFDIATAGATPLTQAGGTQSQDVRVVLEENTDVVDARIEEGAERVVNGESRRLRRNTGSPGGAF